MVRKRQAKNARTRLPNPGPPPPPPVQVLECLDKVKLNNTPVYHLKGVTLSGLQACPKNRNKLKAQLQIDEMQDWESDGASGLFDDEEGNPLVAYFTCRRVTHNLVTRHPTYYKPGPHMPLAMGQSSACLDKAEIDDEKMYFDGIGSTILDRMLVATQLLVHHIGMNKSERDGRHNQANMLCRYMLDGGPPCSIVAASDKKSFILNYVEYVYHDGTFTSEKTGVVHLVHTWPEQGCNPEKHSIHPSSNMVSGCRTIQIIDQYFRETEELAMLLAAMF
ncbi:hypothetical protein EDD22DRAFT_950517 [Suillus occidentalis]|nr:hypothetical protein EDD22DRAFT_950517 [Suillus occidentalis]